MSRSQPPASAARGEVLSCLISPAGIGLIGTVRGTL